MDKLTLNNFTTLYICLSQKWSSVERRAVFDATFLRNCGGNPVILCYKGTQVDLEAESEDIERIYLRREKIKINRILSYFRKIRRLLKLKRFDIVHCYHLPEFWINVLCMKSYLHMPLIFTFNQNLKVLYYGKISQWLLKRADSILTLSAEVNDFVKDSFAINPLKIKTIGCGLDLTKNNSLSPSEKEIACVIDNLAELGRLKTVVRVCSFLKTHHAELAQSLKFSIFLGPRIYQKPSAKKILTELSHEFYAHDIMTYELEREMGKLKKINLLIGVAFEEPLNDFEMRSLIHNIPVLFPRTAARQSLLFRHGKIGESYVDGDVREATAKIMNIIKNYPDYLLSLESANGDIYDVHGLDTYAERLRDVYEGAFAKRQRYIAGRRFLTKRA